MAFGYWTSPLAPKSAAEKTWRLVNANVRTSRRDYLDIYRRAGSYIPEILKGEKRSDLPVQNPIKFQLVINQNPAACIPNQKRSSSSKWRLGDGSAQSTYLSQ